MLMLPSYVPDMTETLSAFFYYEITEFVAIVNSNYHNSVCYVATNTIIRMIDCIQTLHLIFYLQNKLYKTQS